MKTQSILACSTSALLAVGFGWRPAPSSQPEMTQASTVPISPQFSSSDASTLPARSAASSSAKLELMVSEAREEVFEDGNQSVFSGRLEAFVKSEGSDGLFELQAKITSETMSGPVLAEALRWLGRIQDRATHHHRRWLLEYCLRHANPVVRDGAIVGLGSMNDPHSRKAVAYALTCESFSQLSSDLNQLAEQLKNPEEPYALFATSGPSRPLASNS